MKCTHCGGYQFDQPDRWYCPHCGRSVWKGFVTRRVATDESVRTLKQDNVRGKYRRVDTPLAMLVKQIDKDAVLITEASNE